MAWLLNRTLRGVNYIEIISGDRNLGTSFFDFINSNNLDAEEVGRVLKLHSEEIEKLKENEVYLSTYARDNLKDYLEARRAVQDFMDYQHGFKNSEDVAETGQRIPLEALVCHIGLVEIHSSSKKQFEGIHLKFIKDLSA